MSFNKIGALKFSGMIFLNIIQNRVEVERWTVITIGFFYLLGVQGITIRIHLPLNNRLQRLEIDEMDPESLSQERNKFETRWNYFNNIRTLIASAVSFSLMLFIYTN